MPTRPLGEVAAKYDRVIRNVEFDADDQTSETDLLASLLAIRELRSKLQTDEVRLIAASRRKKITWQRLAGALELKSRQAAERRYLQLREDLDQASGKQLTQAERVDFARSQRDRRTERAWAVNQAAQIKLLARRLVSVPDLQERADRSAQTLQAHSRAKWAAEQAGGAEPTPSSAPWPHQLGESLDHLDALQSERSEIATRGRPGQHVGGVRQTDLLHSLAGLIGYALDPSHIDLGDHPELVTDIRLLYAEAGAAAPRPLSEMTQSKPVRRRPVAE
ncbi:hypothetical protein ACODT5_03240 [Streptomyces sp. 5.8]|uniref:hypothetical protein n=1 Tax=Streptomyces sp. 5.8 TaxID=3406571 RepID=UPI003BB7A795